MTGPTKEQKRKLQLKLDRIRRHTNLAGGAKKPVGRGITRIEFHQILDKASQPIKKPESE